ncbi:uncharacterized protein [Oscarella lobularis]|uniref:uncharacterized protein isoform X2 n=1 Tax=Oscarella lobularis TaxID=121494 RepID=UPI0033132BCC
MSTTRSHESLLLRSLSEGQLDASKGRMLLCQTRPKLPLCRTTSLSPYRLGKPKPKHRPLRQALSFGDASISLLKAADPGDDPDQGDKVLRDGGVGAVLDALRRFAENACLQAKGCATLGHLAATEELARAVAAAGGVQQSLQALRHFPNDVDVQKAGCHALANMSLEECVADDVVANGGLELMLAAIARFPDDAELQDSACRAIGSLAANDGLCRQVATAGGMRVVLEAMKKHKESDLVQECGCWAIVSMSENCENCVDLINAGAMDATLYAMEMYYTGDALQEYGCRILANMSVADNFEPSMANEKIVDAILGAMERYTKNLEIQEHALFGLGKVILDSDTIHDHVIQNDGIKLIVSALNAFPNNIQVVQSSCRALGALAMHKTTRHLMEEDGGVDAIIKTIKREELANNQVVQMICCNTLACLVDQADVSLKKRIVDATTTKAMVAAVKTFPSDAELAECVCRAVSSLAASEELLPQVQASGAFQAVLSSLESHKDNPDVQEVGVHAISFADLLKSASPGSVSINALVSAVAGGMNELGDNVTIQMNGCRLLSHCALKESNHVAIAKECGVRATLRTMKGFPKNATIQESGCRLLGLLSYNSETQQYVVSLGGIEATLAAMISCNVAEVLVAACGTLTCVAMTEKNVERIVAQDGIKSIVDSMLAFPENKDVQMTGCLALKMLTESKSVIGKIVSAGGVDALTKAIEAFPKITDLTKEAEDALETIKKQTKT